MSRRRRAARAARTRKPILPLAIAAAVAIALGLAFFPRPQSPSRDATSGEGVADATAEVPDPDTSDMEGPVARAVGEARRSVLANPGSVAAWGRFGIVCDAHELFEAALPCYRVAHTAAPNEFRWAYFLARVLEIQAAPPEEVFAQFEKARALNPGYAPMLVRYGDALSRGGRHEDAQRIFEEAVAADSRLARAHRGLGQERLALDDAPAAVRSLEVALRLEPEDGAAQAALARAYARTGNRDAARLAQQRARELQQIHSFPDAVLAEVSLAAVNADACLRRAADLMREGQHRRAIAQLKIAEESRAEDADFQARLGSAYARVDRTDLAIVHLERALELRPGFWQVHHELGNVRSMRGEFDEAVASYRRAEEADPGNAELTARLAAALAQRGELEAAIAKFEEASRFGSLDARDFNNWGSALAQSGNISAAASRFEEATRLDPAFANAHFNLGVAFEDLGRPDRAMAQYRRVLEIDPRHRAAGRLRALSADGPKR